MANTISELNIETKTYCPCFDGFYESLLSSFDDTYIEQKVEGIENDDVRDFIYSNYTDYFNYKTLNESVSKLVVEFFNDYFIEYNLNIKFEFENLYSPKYYNYESDSINIKVNYNQEFIDFLNDYVHKNQDKFTEYLTKYTSCSGFISYHSDNINDWFTYLNKETLTDNEHYLGSLLEFYFENEESNIKEDIYFYIFDKMLSSGIEIENHFDYDRMIKDINEKLNLNIECLSELEG